MNKNYLSNLTNNDYVNTNSKTNELINQQLDNSEIVYDSVHLQFIIASFAYLPISADSSFVHVRIRSIL